MTPEIKKKYKYNAWIPVDAEDRWKALVIAMHSGEWMQIKDVQRITGFNRKRVRNLLRDAVASGVVEKGDLKIKHYKRKVNRWGEPFSPNSKLVAKEVKYRMDMTKIVISTEEDPSD